MTGFAYGNPVIRARVLSVEEIDLNVKKLSAVNSGRQLAGINQFVAVTGDPEFCLKKALLLNDTRNNYK